MHLHPQDLHHVVRDEGQPTGEHLVEDDPCAVEVGAAIDGHAGGLLGAHVRRRPEDHAHLGQRSGVAGLDHLRDAKVDEFEPWPVLGLADEDVVGFEIAVHDAAAVRMRHGLQHGLQMAQRNLGGQGPIEHIGEFLAPQALHHQVGDGDLQGLQLGRPDVVHLHDACMLEARHGTGLSLEAGAHLRLGHERRLEHLDRDRSVQAEVVSFEHQRHPTFAQHSIHAVALAQHGARQQPAQRRRHRRGHREFLGVLVAHRD